MIEDLTNEINVSILYPNDGIDGTNKYTLDKAINIIPNTFRRAGIKISFLNQDNEIETWESISNNWSINYFIKTGVSEINRIDGEIGLYNFNNELEANKNYQYFYIKGTTGIKISNINNSTSLTYLALEVTDEISNEVEYTSIKLNNGSEKMFENPSTVRVYSLGSRLTIGGNLKFTIVSTNGIYNNSLISSGPCLQQISQRTLYLGNNLVTSVSTGTGWTETEEDKIFTHNSGTDPLTVNVTLKTNKKYLISLTLGNTKEEALHININNYPEIDTYNGSTKFNVGIILSSSVSNIKLTPVSSWTGSTATVSDIEIREVISNSDPYEKTLDLIVLNEEFNQGKNDITSFWNVIIGDTTTGENRQNITRCISIGYQSLRAIISGTRNIGIGTFSMSQLISGDRNVAIGADSFWYMKQGSDNVVMGKSALGAMSLNTVANQNTCIGSASGAGIQSDISENNTCLGMRSMGGNSSTYNTDTNRSSNTCLGAWAGYYADNNNVCVGDYAGHYAKQNNVFIGHRSGYYTKGIKNTYVGNENGSNYVTGDRNTLVGSNISFSANQSLDNIVTINNSIAVGSDSIIEKSNQTVIGNSSITETKIYGDLIIRGTDGKTRKIVFNEGGTCTWEEI